MENTNTNTARIVIPAKAYRDACVFASQEETRYYLQGCVLEPTGHVVATDGRAMFCSWVHADMRANLPAESIIIPFDKKLWAACKPAKRDIYGRWLVIDRGADLNVTIRVACGKLDDMQAPEFTLETKLIDGTFPDWRRVVPKVPTEKLALAPAYNPEFMARFAQVGDYVRPIPTLDESAPMYIDLGRDDAFGVLMPRGAKQDRETPKEKGRIAGSYVLPTMPDWFTGKVQAQPVAQEQVAA